jgi:hypothetical protein
MSDIFEYVTGYFTDASFNIYNADGTLFKTLINTGNNIRDTFVVKYNSNGLGQWANKMGGNDLTYQYSIGFDITCTKYIVVPISNICFPAGTPVFTDQGNIPINEIIPFFNTINNNTIQAVTKTISQDDYLVCFHKNAIGYNYPNKTTIISKDHKIFYKGKMIEAYKFLNHFEKVKKVVYNKEILYNVLMEKYEKIKVNNMICESLHPENVIAKLYKSNYDEKYKKKIIVVMNESINNNNHTSYKKIVKRIFF